MNSAWPAVLYHYTSPSGLAGIVERTQLWATDVRFLNDSQELKYAGHDFLSILAARQTEDQWVSEA